jgi:SAM-dependent methyltransferase
MYGPGYSISFSNHHAGITDPKQPQKVVQWLHSHTPGVFIDYGCGDGQLLREAGNFGWQAIGVEFDGQVAHGTAQRTGAKVVALSEIHDLKCKADVLHLGDVIEHLSDPDRQMPEILNLIKPGGVLLAQGPLEANGNLFTFAVRATRRLRRSRPTEMPPYHVLLATAAGQKRMFQRLGLDLLEYSIHEVAWPAPTRIFVTDLLSPRPMLLFLLRRMSQTVSRFRPAQWGNRYYYAGRVN